MFRVVSNLDKDGMRVCISGGGGRQLPGLRSEVAVRAARAMPGASAGGVAGGEAGARMCFTRDHLLQRQKLMRRKTSWATGDWANTSCTPQELRMFPRAAPGQFFPVVIRSGAPDDELAFAVCASWLDGALLDGWRADIELPRLSWLRIGSGADADLARAASYISEEFYRDCIREQQELSKGYRAPPDQLPLVVAPQEVSKFAALSSIACPQHSLSSHRLSVPAAPAAARRYR